MPIIGAYYCRDKWPVNIANGSDDAESEVYERRIVRLTNLPIARGNKIKLINERSFTGN